MNNRLSIAVKVIASILLVFAVVFPTLSEASTGVRVSHVKTLSSVTFDPCGYQQVNQAAIFAGYTDMGEVYLWQGLCSGLMHTTVVSYQGSQNLYAQVWYNGDCNRVPCSTTNKWPATVWYGTSVNSGDFGNTGGWYYRAYGCIAGICAATPFQYEFRA